jgi:dolichol-phosphate mannosyltransferase
LSIQISVVVATYNNAAGINKFVSCLLEVLESITDNFEIVLINDASSDETANRIQELTKLSNRIKSFALTRNVGQQIAFSAGIAHSSGEYIVLLDDDMLPNIDSLNTVLTPVIKGECDVCIATCSPRGILRRATSFVFWKAISGITNNAIPHRELTLRCFTREVANSYIKYGEQHRSLTEIMYDIGFTRHYVNLEALSFIKLSSRHNFHNRFRLFLQITLAMRKNSGLGLIYFSFVTLALFLPGLVISYLLGLIDFKNSAYTIIVAIIWVTWSVTIFVLGLIMFLISVILRETRNRPLYHIRERQ